MAFPEELHLEEEYYNQVAEIIKKEAFRWQGDSFRTCSIDHDYQQYTTQISVCFSNDCTHYPEEYFGGYQRYDKEVTTDWWINSFSCTDQDGQTLPTDFDEEELYKKCKL